jgi:hypothetical protein
MTFEEVKKSGKMVTLELVGLDSNAGALMGAFEEQARKEHWSREEILAVRGECWAGDYDHLLCTLDTVCQAPELEEDEEFEDENEEEEED